ncbi:unnamed protein product [Darwinula stevensoni]|uniref:Uncharacterized protein n=1 Tax=Darwinula stevensoni TaxID=69355 RepID=A0A7R8X3C0_9CRUS|nr:unnamed protein product [Darwinula stevensoni]CAG0884801.1 unnamed protein product [Darwinula stevensoni]
MASVAAGKDPVGGDEGRPAGGLESAKDRSDGSYKYKFHVRDKAAGNYQSRIEEKKGDHVVGSYSYVLPDGAQYSVHYVVGPKTGFVPIVQRQVFNPEQGEEEDLLKSQRLQVSPQLRTIPGIILPPRDFDVHAILREKAARADARRKAAAARRAEEARKAEGARRAEEARKAEEARRAEEARKVEEEHKVEEARRIEEARKAEEGRKVEEDREVEEEKAVETRMAAGARRAEDMSKAENNTAEWDKVEPERTEDGGGIQEVNHDDPTDKDDYEGRKEKREEEVAWGEKLREGPLTRQDTPLPLREGDRDKKSQHKHIPTTYIETDHYTVRF